MPLGPELVCVRDGRFKLAGAPFTIVGANNYYAAFASPKMRQDVIAAAQAFGFNVLRCWAFLDCCDNARLDEVHFQPWRGTCFQNGNRQTAAPFVPPQVNEHAKGLDQLDQLIYEADQAGIRLILPLVNYWQDYGGMDCYVAWYGGGARDRFYRDPQIRGAYQAYVRTVLTRDNRLTGRRYCDEPAILAWELANEPECNSPDGGAVLLEWVQTMARWAKQCDPNHLLAVGDEGYFAGGRTDLYDGSHGVDCEAFLGVPQIDFGTFHMYPQTWKAKDPVAFGIDWIQRHLDAGARGGKPMLLEEYGMDVSANGLPSALPREFIYRCWLETLRAKGGAGDLAWMIAADDDLTHAPYDGGPFTFYSPGDAMSIRDHALEMLSAAPSDGVPAFRNPGAEEMIVMLWVTQKSGLPLEENSTGVILRRNGQEMADPLQLNFSTGEPAELIVPAFPLGEMSVEIRSRDYRTIVSDFFRPEPHARLFLHLKTTHA